MKRLSFYATLPHDCNYRPDQLAVSAVADPRAQMSTAVYGDLIARGFRRSGEHVYAPHCPSCRSCIPTRVAVERFTPNRSQRRNLRRNADLGVFRMPARADDEYFALYERYLQGRHPGGGMDDPTPETFENFLVSDWCDTLFVEFREGKRLLGLAVTDLLPNGLSATYTFYDPEDGSARGLGTYAILWQIEEARRRHLPHLYLGYFIPECGKMNYKHRFRPVEGLIEGEWQDILPD